MYRKHFKERNNTDSYAQNMKSVKFRDRAIQNEDFKNSKRQLLTRRWASVPQNRVLCHFELFISSTYLPLRLAWIGRLLGDTDDSWKVIPNYYFLAYGDLQFLLKLNYDAETLNKCLPNFYRELLQYFQEFKNKTNTFSFGEFLLWNNKAITIEKNPLFWRSWFTRKILFVQDFLNVNGNFLTLEEFQNKFKIKINYLHYFQLLAAIPVDLKKKAAKTEIPSHELLSTAKLSSSDTSSLDLYQLKCVAKIIIKSLMKIVLPSQVVLRARKSNSLIRLQIGKSNFYLYIKLQRTIN